MNKKTIVKLIAMRAEYMAIYDTTGFCGFSDTGIQVTAGTLGKLIQERGLSYQVFRSEGYYEVQTMIDGMCFYTINTSVKFLREAGIAVPENWEEIPVLT